MARDRGGSGLTRRLARHPWLLPAAVVLALSLPCFGFGYLWDDYSFVQRGLAHRLTDLLPDPTDSFYRPLSRGLYFMFLTAQGAPGAILAHFFNAAFLVAIVGLLVSFVARMAGHRAGLLAGLAFAALAPLPFLVGWASGAQDLMGMVFLLGALHLRLSGRNALALAAALGGLASKETALIVVPILVLFDWIAGRRPYRILPQAALYAVVVGVWAAIHPGIPRLLARGLRSGATGYVGMEHPGHWPVFFLKYLLTLLNIPVTGLATPWPVSRTVFLLLAAGIAVAGLRVVWRRLGSAAPVAVSASAPGRRPLLILALLLCLLPLLVTVTLVRNFAPYYAMFSGLGSSILLGLLLPSRSFRWTASAIVIFLALGVWCRGLTVRNASYTDLDLEAASQVLSRVEAGFHQLAPTLPPGSQVLASVQTRGPAGVYFHIFTLQALRTWYREPSLITRKPEERAPGARPEFLFAVTPGLDVIQIDPASLRAVSSGAEPDYAFVEGAVRSYASGLAGSGETDAAVRLLTGMPEISGPMRNMHWRTAAMFLLAEGRSAEAGSLLQKLPPLPRGYALVSLRALLAEQPPGRVLDAAGLQAFGLPERDPDAIRDLMRWFASMKYAQVALRFAERLETVAPGDAEARSTAAQMRRVLEEERKNQLPAEM